MIFMIRILSLNNVISMPTAAGAASPTFQLTVQDTNPIWIFCERMSALRFFFFVSQVDSVRCPETGHCGQGMVFAVNPPPEGSANSFSAFQALAIQTNGTNSSTTAGSSYVTPPPPSWETATATVALSSSTWTTVYTSYDGTPREAFFLLFVTHVGH
jgi:hypothetical protein